VKFVKENGSSLAYESLPEVASGAHSGVEPCTSPRPPSFHPKYADFSGALGRFARKRPTESFLPSDKGVREVRAYINATSSISQTLHPFRRCVWLSRDPQSLLLCTGSQHSDSMTHAGDGEATSQAIKKPKRSMKKCDACRSRKIAVSATFAKAVKMLLEMY
jgi:hypothetical protein